MPTCGIQQVGSVSVFDCQEIVFGLSVKSKEYIMAKIADYTERTFNQV